MRRGKQRKFGREKNQRKALYKALATALIENGKIRTTTSKAKSLSQYADKLVTQAKKGDLAARKLIGYNLGDKAAKKLLADIVPKLKDRKGGYTKVLKLGRRVSDGAEMAQIEFTN